MKNTQQEIIEVLSNLVSIPSVSNNKKALQEIIAYAKTFLSIPDLTIEEYTHNDFPSLVIKPKNWKKTELLLNAHLDVVPAKEEQFALQTQEDKVYGRGVLDMKGAAAIFLLLVKKLALEHKLPDNTALMLVTDEEVGGDNGTKYLLEERNVVADFFLAGEPTNLTICNKQKGVLWVALEERGEKAHASKPWLGKNANISLIEKLESFYKDIPQAEEGKWITTYNLAVFRGGDAVNVVPDKAEAIIDIRKVEKESSSDILAKFHKSFPGTNISVLEDEPCLFTDKNDPFIVKIQELIKKEFGKDLSVSQETFASDGRFYSMKGIPSINLGPSGENMHGDNEFVNLQSLTDYYDLLEMIIKSWKNI